MTLLPVAASIHYANEYADYETDLLTQRTAFSGGSGAWQMGGLPRRAALHMARFTLAIGLLMGLLGVLLMLMPPLTYTVLVVGALGGWMYSMPPLKLAWRGWGELTNALLGSTALMLYGASLITYSLSWQTLLISVPFTGAAFVNLLATTWTDREADKRVGKYTLATVYEPHHLRRLYAAVVIVSLLCGALIYVMGWVPQQVMWAWLITLPLVWWGYRTYTRQHLPHPSVIAMICMMVVQAAVWGSLLLQQVNPM